MATWSRPWSAAGSAFLKSLPKLRRGLLQSLAHDLDVVDDRHEVRISIPARHHMEVNVVWNPGPSGASHVRPYVESIRRHRAPQHIYRPPQSSHEMSRLRIVEELQPGHVRVRRHHRVARVVRELVQ